MREVWVDFSVKVFLLCVKGELLGKGTSGSQETEEMEGKRKGFSTRLWNKEQAITT